MTSGTKSKLKMHFVVKGININPCENSTTHAHANLPVDQWWNSRQEVLGVEAKEVLDQRRQTTSWEE